MVIVIFMFSALYCYCNM